MPDTPTATATSADPRVIEVIEETATVDKVERITGRVRVSTRTQTVEQTINETLEGVAVEVRRVPVNREIGANEPVPATRQEGEVTIVPVLEEVIVVEKRLVLREEVHIHQSRTRDDVAVPVTLRRQEAVVSREPADGAGANIDED